MQRPGKGSEELCMSCVAGAWQVGESYKMSLEEKSRSDQLVLAS